MVKAFVFDLVKLFAESGVDTYSAVSFDHILRSVIPPKTDFASFKSHVNAIPFTGGGTDLAAGIDGCADLLKHLSGNRAIIFITDGDGNNKAARVAAQNAKNKGIVISTVGIGSKVKKGLLRKIASDRKLFIHTTFSRIYNIPDIIIGLVCGITKPSPFPKTPTPLPKTPSPKPHPGDCEALGKSCRLRFNGGVHGVKEFVLKRRRFKTPIVRDFHFNKVKFGSPSVKTFVLIHGSLKLLPHDLFIAVRIRRHFFRFELYNVHGVSSSDYIDQCLKLEVVVHGGHTECAVIRIRKRRRRY